MTARAAGRGVGAADDQTATAGAVAISRLGRRSERQPVWRLVATIGLAVAMVAFFAVVLANARASWRLVIGWGINPWVYAALWLASVPPYWLALFRIKDGFFERDRSMVWSGLVLNRTAWAAPYLYAAIAGSGLPAWVRPALGLYMATMVVYYVTRLRDPAFFVKLTESRLATWVTRPWLGRNSA